MAKGAWSLFGFVCVNIEGALRGKDSCDFGGRLESISVRALFEGTLFSACLKGKSWCETLFGKKYCGILTRLYPTGAILGTQKLAFYDSVTCQL